MAINAFAEFMKTYCMSEASPWPFHYEIETGQLWMPARMELPSVMERLLALCSGDGPLVLKVKGEQVGDSILLLDEDQKGLVKVSSVYDQMKDGRWLCYKWIPRPIASHVASLLGGELRDI